MNRYRKARAWFAEVPPLQLVLMVGACLIALWLIAALVWVLLEILGVVPRVSNGKPSNDPSGDSLRRTLTRLTGA